MASANTWGLVVFFTAFANLFTGNYAVTHLSILVSIYPGYSAEKNHPSAGHRHRLRPCGRVHIRPDIQPVLQQLYPQAQA